MIVLGAFPFHFIFSCKMFYTIFKEQKGTIGLQGNELKTYKRPEPSLCKGTAETQRPGERLHPTTMRTPPHTTLSRYESENKFLQHGTLWDAFHATLTAPLPRAQRAPHP